jgi:hypothetical protein
MSFATGLHETDFTPGASGDPTPPRTSDHHRLTDAGWSYRTNAERGWIVYRDRGTQKWYSRKDALAILDKRLSGLSATG